jgi:hypothetical protein
MMLGYPEISIDEIRRNYRPGEFRRWFDRETLDCFGERLPVVGVRTWHGVYFLTCNSKPDGHSRYTVRRQDLLTGNIETVGEFREHENFAKAKGALAVFLRSKEPEDECLA